MSCALYMLCHFHILLMLFWWAHVVMEIILTLPCHGMAHVGWQGSLIRQLGHADMNLFQHKGHGRGIILRRAVVPYNATI